MQVLQEQTTCSKFNVPETQPVHRPTVKCLCSEYDSSQKQNTLLEAMDESSHRYLSIFIQIHFALTCIMSRPLDQYVWMCKNFCSRVVLMNLWGPHVWASLLLLILLLLNGDTLHCGYVICVEMGGSHFWICLGVEVFAGEGLIAEKDHQGLHLEQCLGNWWGLTGLYRKICPVPIHVSLPLAKAIKLMLI